MGVVSRLVFAQENTGGHHEARGPLLFKELEGFGVDESNVDIGIVGRW